MDLSHILRSQNKENRDFRPGKRNQVTLEADSKEAKKDAHSLT
jgi:hypothetical protein